VAHRVGYCLWRRIVLFDGAMHGAMYHEGLSIYDWRQSVSVAFSMGAHVLDE